MRNNVKAKIRLVFSLWLLTVAIVAVGHAGDVIVDIKQWKLPSGDLGVHDSLAARDGSIWYTGIGSNTLGRFDPKTEQFKVYLLKTADSNPHGIIEDQEGNIWYTSATPYPKAHVGKLNPKTEEITEYFIKSPQVLRPHTPFFDRKGNLWFTCSGSNEVGKLDPKTGQITLLEPPMGPEDSPYAPVWSEMNITSYDIKVDSKGILWFTMARAPKIASIDPDTMVVHEYTLPNPASRGRRIDFTPGDVMWYADWIRGYLLQFDPKTGKVIKEWPSPGGSWSQPYGLIAMGDIIWYSEAGARPVNIVRFEPKTEKFQSWPVNGCGRVHDVDQDSDKNVWFVCDRGHPNTLVKVTVTEEARTP